VAVLTELLTTVKSTENWCFCLGKFWNVKDVCVLHKQTRMLRNWAVVVGFGQTYVGLLIWGSRK